MTIKQKSSDKDKKIKQKKKLFFGKHFKQKLLQYNYMKK